VDVILVEVVPKESTDRVPGTGYGAVPQ